MRIEDLQYFRELAHQQNVTYAAEVLRITQPTLSRSLARLEADIGVALFDRQGRKLRLNAYGEILLPHVARMMAELNDGRVRIDAMKNPSVGVVSLAFVTSFGSWLVPSMIHSYRQLFPQVRFLLRGGPADEVVHDVRAGRADIGFVSPRPTSDDLVWDQLEPEELALSVAATHPLAGLAMAEPHHIDGLELVTLRPEFGLRQITENYFERLGIQLNVTMETTEIPTTRALVLAGLGASILPTSPTIADGLTQIPLAEPVVRIAGMIVSESRQLPSAAAQFARFVREEHRGAMSGV